MSAGLRLIPATIGASSPPAWTFASVVAARESYRGVPCQSGCCAPIRYSLWKAFLKTRLSMTVTATSVSTFVQTLTSLEALLKLVADTLKSHSKGGDVVTRYLVPEQITVNPPLRGHRYWNKIGRLSCRKSFRSLLEPSSAWRYSR